MNTSSKISHCQFIRDILLSVFVRRDNEKCRFAVVVASPSVCLCVRPFIYSQYCANNPRVAKVVRSSGEINCVQVDILYMSQCQIVGGVQNGGFAFIFGSGDNGGCPIAYRTRKSLQGNRAEHQGFVNGK